MTGSVVESSRGGRFWPILMALVAVTLVATAAATGKANWAVGALIPAGLAAGSWLGRPKPVRFAVEEDRLAFEPIRADVPYADIRGLTPLGKPAAVHFPFEIDTDRGPLMVPASASEPTNRLFAFLLSQLSESGGRDVPKALEAFRDEQEAKFGAERVFTFRARPNAPVRQAVGAVGAFLGLAAGFFLAAAAGAAVGPDDNPFLPLGLVGGVFSLLLTILVGKFGGRSLPKGWGSSGLVIGPAGLALVQGNLKGRMRWDEVRSIDHPPKGGDRRQAWGRNGVGVAVAGAYIVIGDYYDRPGMVIYRRLNQYWGEGG